MLRSDDSSEVESAGNPTHLMDYSQNLWKTAVSTSLGRVGGWNNHLESGIHHFYWCEGRHLVCVTTLWRAVVSN